MFRYENYGTTALLLTSGTTVETGNAKYGTAFWGSDSTQPNFTVPAGVKEIWMRCDFYPTSSFTRGNRLSFGHYSATLNGYVGVWNGTSYGTGIYSAYGLLIDAHPTTAITTRITFSRNSFHSALLHMVSDASDGIIELTVDNTTYTYTGNVNNGDDFDCLYFYSDSARVIFSNIVVSDSQLTLADNAKLPLDVLFDTNRIATQKFNLDVLFDTSRIATQKFNLDALFDTKRWVVRQLIQSTTYFLHFNGSNNYAQLPLDLLPGATTFTIEAKFSTTSTKQSSNNYQWATIVGREINGNWKDDFGLCVNNGKLCFWSEPSSDGSTNTRNTVSDAVVNDGQIHEVVVVSSDGNIDLYCDGVNVAHTDNVNAKITSAYSILIGYNTDSKSYLEMNLYEVRFWNVARTDFFSAINGDEGGLQGWYLVGANGLVDVSTNNRQPTLFNSPVLDAVYYPTLFDTQRNIVSDGSFDVLFDTQRNIVSDNNSVTVDTLFDTKRRVAVPSRFSFDFTFNADTKRIVGNSFDLPFDTKKNVIRSLDSRCDLIRKIPHLLSTDAARPTLKEVSLQIESQQLTDQMSFTSTGNFHIMELVQGSFLNYQYSFRVESLSIRGSRARNGQLTTCKCCSDIDELLYTQIAYKLGRKLVSGGLFYIDESQNNKVTAITNPYAYASSHIQKIASILHKHVVLQFDDFLSSVDIEQSGVTYQDLISEIFGWSSRIPHKLINVFIRGDTLYVIQRGYEQFPRDISNSKIDNLVTKKEVVRTSWGVTHDTAEVEDLAQNGGFWDFVLGNEITDEEPPEDEPLDDENEDPTRVLPDHVTTTENGVTTDIYYTYDEDDNVIKTVTTTEGGDYNTRVVVENHYRTINGNKYLEYETTTEYEEELATIGEQTVRKWVVVSRKVVKHTYLTQGQQHVASISDDGTVDGSITAPARINDKPTPYDDKVNQDSRYSWLYSVKVDGYTYWSLPPALKSYTYVDGKKIEVLGRVWRSEKETVRTIALYDDTFPIDSDSPTGRQKLRQITSDLQWLNRKTQETVTLDVYDFQHIFDFNDKIILFGNIYFLQSNSFTINEEITNKQSLELVRWY